MPSDWFHWVCPVAFVFCQINSRSLLSRGSIGENGARSLQSQRHATSSSMQNGFKLQKNKQRKQFDHCCSACSAASNHVADVVCDELRQWWHKMLTREQRRRSKQPLPVTVLIEVLGGDDDSNVAKTLDACKIKDPSLITEPASSARMGLTGELRHEPTQ